jgi:hypothetical protein
MRLEQNIPFDLDGYECVMRTVVDATILEDDFTYKIVDLEMIQFHGQTVSVILDEVDVKGSIARQIDAYLDEYISEHSRELLEADRAYDLWKETREHE